MRRIRCQRCMHGTGQSTKPLTRMQKPIMQKELLQLLDISNNQPVSSIHHKQRQHNNNDKLAKQTLGVSQKFFSCSLITSKINVEQKQKLHCSCQLTFNCSVSQEIRSTFFYNNCVTSVLLWSLFHQHRITQTGSLHVNARNSTVSKTTEPKHFSRCNLMRHIN